MDAAELVVRITGDIDDVTRSVDRIGRQVDDVGSRIERAASKGFGALERWAKRGALAAGVALTAIAAGVANVGMAYEDALNTFEVVSGATVAQMDAVGAKAKELGNDLTLPGTSAADAAEAMTELAKAGLSVEESMDAAKGVLQLAAAAQVEEAQAAEYTASALNAFNLEGKQAVKVADLLAGASVAAMGEITDMGDAMKMSAAVFNMAGFTVEDLTTAISMMAQAGIKGSDAGTSLKQSVLQLLNPSDKAKALIRQLGIEIYDATGQLKPFRDIIGEVTAATAHLGEEQRNAALGTIFGSDAIRAAAVVYTQGTEGFDKMAAAVTRQGVAAEVAAAKTKGLRGAWEAIQSTLETGALTLYAFIAPPVTEFLRGIGVGMNMLADDPGWQRFSERAKETFQPFLDLLTRLGTAMQEGGFRAGFAELRASIEETFGKLDVHTILNDVLARIDWVTLSQQITNGMVLLMTSTDWAKVTETAVLLLFQIAPQIIDGFIRGLISAALSNPLDFVMFLLAMGFMPVKVLGALTAVLGRIPIFGPLFSWLLTGFGSVGRAVTGPIRNIFDDLGRKGMAGLRNGLDDAWQAVSGWLGGMGGRISGFFANAGSWLVSAGRAIVNGLWSGMKAVAESMFGWVGSIASKIISLKGPLTYDRVMLEPAGEAIIGGLIRGMQAEEARLTALLQSMTTGIESTVTFAPPPAPAPMVSAGVPAAPGGPRVLVLQLDRQEVGRILLPEIRDGLAEVDVIDPGSGL